MSPKREIEQKWIDQITPEITDAVRAAQGEDGRLGCERARRLADELGVPTIVVGAAATEAGVRIHNCGLGCF